MENEIKLVALVLNYNDAQTTIDYVNTIKDYSIINHILIVDNCSNDDSLEQLTCLTSDKISVIKTEKNGGYGYGNNQGIKYIVKAYKATHILISNPDVKYEEKVLISALNVFEEDNSVAVVAPFMKNIYGIKEKTTAWKVPSKYEYIFSSEVFCSKLCSLNRYDQLDEYSKTPLLEVDCVAGSMLLVNAQSMMKHGMYDENIFLYGEETVLGVKLKKAGMKTVLLIDDCFIHAHGVSINKSIKSEIKRHRMMLNSRLYILQSYLGASKADLLLAKIVFLISVLECKLIFMVRKGSNN